MTGCCATAATAGTRRFGLVSFCACLALVVSLTSCAGMQHPGYLASSEPCKGPSLSVAQGDDPGAEDRVFTVTGVGSAEPRGGAACHLAGTIDLTISDVAGRNQLTHVSSTFDQTVGSSAKPLVLRFTWRNWCSPDPHASLAYQYRVENSQSGGSRALDLLPACVDRTMPTTLTAG